MFTLDGSSSSSLPKDRVRGSSLLLKPDVDGPSEIDGPADTFGISLRSSEMRLKLEFGRDGFFGFGRLIESVTYLKFLILV